MTQITQAYEIEYSERDDVRTPLPGRCGAQGLAALNKALRAEKAKIVDTLTGWPGVTHTLRVSGRYFHVQLS